MNSRLIRTTAHVVLWGFVASALYEGYLTLPGMAGHSIYSILARVLLIPLPVAAAILWWRLRPPGTVLVALWTAWLIWVAISFATHPQRTYPVEYYVWSQIGGWLIVLALWLLARYPDWIQAFWQWALPAYWLATIVVALWEIHTGHHLGASSVHGLPIPTAFYFNPNDLGAALALALPFMWFWPTVRPSLAGKVGAALITGASIVLLIKTGSRGGEIALLVDLLALPAVLKGPLRRWALAMLGLGIGSLAVLVVWARSLGPAAQLPLYLSKLARLPDLFTTHIPTHLPPNVPPGSVAIRWALYRSGIWALSTHPWGLGPRGAERWFSYWIHHGSPYNTYGIIDAHNVWLEVAMNFGWPGIILFVAAFTLTMVYAYRAAKSALPLKRGLGQASFCALGGFIIGGLSPSSVMFGFDIMWVTLGLGLAAWRLPEP